MSAVGELLPAGATGSFDRALAAGMSDDLEVPFDELLDPYRTPARLLPWLAEHHSVDLWFDDWSEERKREMIAQCAGVSTIYPGEPLAELKGTLEGLKRYLWFVDATIVDRVAHPTRFIMGRAVLDRTPISHQPFTAHYLIKVRLEAHCSRFEIGQAAFGRRALVSVNREPLRRVKLAMVTAKAPDTLYSVTFAWRRQHTFDDGILFDDGHLFSGYIDRTRF